MLGALAKIPPDVLTRSDQLFKEYEGAFVENYVAQQLKSLKEITLHYWKSAGTAEIDFICEYENNIFPLEAKAGINPRSKSLLFYQKKYNPTLLSRTTLLNLKRDGKICNYPLYAISLFPELSIRHFGFETHSYFNASTGLAVAAVNAWKLTVSVATTSAKTAANTNENHSRLMR